MEPSNSSCVVRIESRYINVHPKGTEIGKALLLTCPTDDSNDAWNRGQRFEPIHSTSADAHPGTMESFEVARGRPRSLEARGDCPHKKFCVEPCVEMCLILTDRKVNS